MRHIDERDAQLSMQSPNFELHAVAKLLVERPERLVHQEHARVENNSARQCHALLLPAGKLARIARAVSGHAHHLQRAVHLGADRRRGRAALA